MKNQWVNCAVALAMSAALSSCAVMDQPMKTTIQHEQTDGHTSQNALDWQGTYKGVVPCADCEGIATQLSLSADAKYTLKTQYLGKGKNEFVEKGSFTWNQQGSVITLNGIKQDEAPTQYQVGENRLIQLDLEGNRITGGLADQYVLTKVMQMPIEDKKWKLVELNGQAVKGTAKTHYLILHSDTQQVEAKAGCNAMFGGYELKNQFQLSFKKMASTLMACENMEQETAFSKVLTMADNFSFSGNTMSLNKARMAPLARFELVLSE